ncbi:transcription initiation factor IID, 18kD subunit-domain-containing protein [Chytridium lagenaria]|nr:transcription initiation factor IID, 18kD subunit-domain-containing protein [Chytridium lagenaria]KAI8851942.1 transcription initiation factor IID, 18kD subunit-domain-containing protein [Chytridium lagenaria]
MFVFGEVQEPLEETTELVEEITRAQITEFIVQSVAQAHKRASKHLSAEDLIFLIRHDQRKTNRLRTFLSWKDVRKGVPDAEEGMAVDEPEQKTKANKMRVKFSWDLLNNYASVLSDDEGDDEEEDDDERQASEDQIARLRVADEVTRTMTKEDYMYYADCRQASFTYKKNKRFRDWCNMAIHYKNNKPNGDVIDVLGFLACECVAKLTETALSVKKVWDERDKEYQNSSYDNICNNPNYLFGRNTFEQQPLQPTHILEAFRRLQDSTYKMSNFRGGLVRNPLTLF